MTDNKFFVMLQHPNGLFYPMLGDDDEIARYATKAEARKTAKNNPLGENYGYEIFKYGTGDS